MTTPLSRAPLRIRRARWIRAVIVACVALPSALIADKLLWLGYSLSDVLPRTRYQVTYDMKLDGHGSNVRVRTFLPASDERQTVSEEENAPSPLHFRDETTGLNREGIWSGSDVPDNTRLRYGFSILAQAQRYEIDPGLPVPLRYPSSVLAHLRPEPDIQVDAPEIAATLARIGAHQGPVLERLRRIYDFTRRNHGLRLRTVPQRRYGPGISEAAEGKPACRQMGLAHHGP